jgi:2',3'-cyclic-nucleotide 2'-phosphodiesterase (5'-nucleotidase family)
VAPVRILHTADLHNRLSPAAARQLSALKRERDGTILLDAGDAIAAGNLTFRIGGEPILRRMAEVGYDAMAMGNRESHPSRRFLERKLRDASFPVLAANVQSKRQPLPAVVRDHVILNGCEGRTVAVIGLAPQITPPDSAWARVTDYVFEDPVATAEKLAARLREQADLVVCLSHCGEEVDRRLAAIGAVELVLGGHTHSNFVIEQQGDALIVPPGHHGSHVASTELLGRDEASSALIPLETGL